MSQGIYQISNDATSRTYIGASNNIDARINDHLTGERSNAWLQTDIQRHGVEHFKARTRAIASNVSNNTLGALETVILSHEYYVKDSPVYNVKLHAGEHFVSDTSAIDNAVQWVESTIEGIESKTIKVTFSKNTNTLSFSDGSSITLYAVEPLELLNAVLPFLLMFQIGKLSSTNPDIQKMASMKAFLGVPDALQVAKCELMNAELLRMRDEELMESFSAEAAEADAWYQSLAE